MRPTILAITIAIITSTGCTHHSLERNTINQVGTVSDMRYRLVLDNLAVAAVQPGSLPFHTVISGGATTVNDSRGLNSATVINAMAFDNQAITLDGRRDVTENWTLDPVFEPEKLIAMRCAYQWAICGAELSPEGLEDLRKFGVLDRLTKIPHGWISVGCKRDVPKGACYVSHWKGKFVWVEAAGMEALSQFTLVIQDIATTDVNTLDKPTPTKSVTIEEYRYEGDKVKQVTKTTRVLTDDEKVVPPAVGTPGTTKMRLDFRGSDTRLRTLLNQQRPR